MKYKVLKNMTNQMKIHNELTKNLWPEFMFHDSISNKYWNKLYELFPEYQISIQYNGEIIAMANSIPLKWIKSFDKLPERGWDWSLEKGINDKLDDVKPNILNALQIAIKSEFQNKGISSIVLEEMKKIAKNNGYRHLTVPVRPSFKSRYPLQTIDNYITWKRDDGLPYDPWLRVHVRSGGKIIKACHKAMYIHGNIIDWENWTDKLFFESGKYIIPGALRPIKIDLKEDIGKYIEPNVWVVHSISEE